MQEKTLADFIRQAPLVAGVKKIIAVACAKGGVGKSSVAANLAVTLQKQGLKVALVDADIYGPSQAHLMNLQGKIEQKDGLILPKISHQIKCISIASIVDFETAGVWRGPMVTKILQQLIRSVNWQSDGFEVDVMLLDMPPGTGDVYLSIAERFPLAGVILVSTPQSLALIDLVKSIDCFEKLKIPVLGLVENMSYLEINGQKHYIFGQEAVQKFAKELKIKFLGEIPLIPEIAKLSDAKKLAVLENAEISEIFEKIVKNLEI
jgi:ATP-binding protein involved in chromosome partitioning